jgi:phosphoglycolate phosphatase-like HAD superfamily hydrolase
VRKYLFWDIDGTLLLTNRAGVFALEDAALQVTGAKPDLAKMRTAGMTDAQIGRDIVGEEHLAAFLAAYERLLPERLSWREGRVLPNVRENLEALAQRDDVVNMLLTGNVAGGAEAKLRHYDLWQYFGAGGAFSVEGDDRPAIARRARELAAEHGGEVPPGERMFVIGDTPHDVHCGDAIGARTVAVATGPGYDLEALRASEPWVLLEQLPEPPAFQAVLETP